MSNRIEKYKILLVQVFLVPMILDASQSLSTVRSQVDSVIKSGTAIEALQEYYRIQKLAEKNPAYRVQLERIRDGLRGKTNVKRNNRGTNQKGLATFDPVEVEAKVKEMFGDDYTIKDFIDEFGDLEKINRDSRRSMLADEKAGTTRMRKAQSKRLEKAEEVFDIFDKQMSDKVDDIKDSLTGAIDTTRGITQKAFSITPSVIKDLTQKYWARALEAYYNISLDKENRKVLKDVAAGLNGATGKYQRVKNPANSVYPFDVKKVLEAIEAWPTNVPTFINDIANIGQKELAVSMLNGANIEWMIKLRDNINGVVKIVRIMDPEDAQRFEKFNKSIDDKLEPRIKALTKGPWYQALEVYYEAYQSAQGDDERLQFVEDVIEHGLLGDGDREEFNRTDDPLDVVKIIQVLTDNNVEPYGFCEQYATYAKSGKTYKDDITDTFKKVRSDDKELQKLVSRLENDKKLVEELDNNRITLADLPTVKAIEKAMETIGSRNPATKKRVLGSSWQQILLGYYDTPEAERPALAKELQSKRNINMQQVVESMAAMKTKISAQETVDRYGSKEVYIPHVVKAITDSFNAGNTKVLGTIHDQLKQLKNIVTVLEGTDKKYAAELAALMHHVVRIHNSMKHSRDGIFEKQGKTEVCKCAGLVSSNQLQDILLAYDIIYQCSQNISLPQEFRVALQQGIVTVVNPGLKGQKTGWQRKDNPITYDVAQVIADIKAIPMTVEDFAKRYGNITTYNNYVVGLVTTAAFDKAQEPAKNKEIERSLRVLPILKKIDQTYATRIGDIANKLIAFKDPSGSPSEPAKPVNQSSMNDLD